MARQKQMVFKMSGNPSGSISEQHVKTKKKKNLMHHPQLHPATKVLSGYLLTLFFKIYTIFNLLLFLQFEAQTCPTMEGSLRNLLAHGTQLHHF
jgi:hypothetical protein